MNEAGELSHKMWSNLDGACFVVVQYDNCLTAYPPDHPEVTKALLASLPDTWGPQWNGESA